ncbi:MAG: redoxin domain-containing protein [Candidatus Omnitrophica bacterium]|nr:hypothetical protein [bacterium]NUN97366.1 redoxin domain-containing protein [Candidatus Omnitrophota bacterium]
MTPRPSVFRSIAVAPILLAFLSLAGIQAAGKRDLPFQSNFPDDFPTVDQLKFLDISKQTLKGEEFLGKPVLVIFFDPGCGKCTGKLPTIEKIRKNFSSEGVTVLGLSSKGGGLGSVSSSYPEWIWVTNSPGIKHKLQSSRTMEAFVFDRLGQVAFRVPIDGSEWKTYLELGLGAVSERALDLSDMPHGFAGSDVCGMCHRAEYDQWKSTPHARGYEVLVETNNLHRPECHSCHVTAEQGRAERPWPVTARGQLTPKEFQEIGCEECHGPGGPHRTKPFAEGHLYSTKEESCLRCHNAEVAGCAKDWKTEWNYSEYLKQVAHGAGSTTRSVPDPIEIQN